MSGWLYALVRWLCFSVFIGSAPVLADAAIRMLAGDAQVVASFSEGHLFVIASVLCATALGKLVTSGMNGSLVKAITAIGCLLVLSVAVQGFVRRFSAPPTVVGLLAIATFSFAVISSACAIVLAQVFARKT